MPTELVCVPSIASGFWYTRGVLPIHNVLRRTTSCSDSYRLATAGTVCSVVQRSDTQITCTMPPGAGMCLIHFSLVC